MSNQVNDQLCEDMIRLIVSIMSDMRKLKEMEESFTLLDRQDELIANTIAYNYDNLKDVFTNYQGEQNNGHL